MREERRNSTACGERVKVPLAEYYYTHDPPCDTRRRENVGALYSTVSGLLAIISRA